MRSCELVMSRGQRERVEALVEEMGHSKIRQSWHLFRDIEKRIMLYFPVQDLSSSAVAELCMYGGRR